MATTVARLQAVLAAETGQFDRSMDRSEGKMLSLGKVAKLVGGAAVIGALGKGLKSAASAAMESEKAEVRLTSAMNQVGVSAKQRAAANKAISATSRRAALDDEELSDVYSKLLRTTKSTTEAQEGMNLAADIARARNISLAAASKAVERAYNGTGAGLARFGVEVEKVTTNYDLASLAVAQQKEQMKGLSGTALEAAKVQLNQLEAAREDAKLKDKQAAATNALKTATQQFAGSAEAYGKTSAGAQERFQVAVENLQERIGKKLLPVLARLAERGVQLLTWAEANWPKFEEVVSTAMGKAKAAFDSVWPIIKKIGEWGLWLAEEVVIPVLKPLFTTVIPTAFKFTRDAFQFVADVAGKVQTAFVWLRDKGGAAIGAVRTAAEKPLEALRDAFDAVMVPLQKIIDAIKWLDDKAGGILGKIGGVLGKLPGSGDPRDPTFTGPTHPSDGGINLMGASPVMAPFAIAAAAHGLSVTSGLRPGAITANGTPSDHGIGKALDVAGSANAMASFFMSLIGNRSVKQAFYDPRGSIFGGAWSSYREGGHSDHVHVATYDKGGVLRPGWTMAYNGTGQNEYVSKGQPILLTLNLDGQPFARAIFDDIRNENVRQGRLGRGL